jgi:acylphosphatase
MTSGDAEKAIRARARGRVQAVGFREATTARASELGVLGWVRNEDDGSVAVHAEGEGGAVDKLVEFLRDGPPGAQVDELDVDGVKVEGHEQFAIRGVPAGLFSVVENEGGPFELRLEVAGVLQAWALPKGPSMDPAQKRFAIEIEVEPGSEAHGSEWDRGTYEQGGRVPWPEAIERGHVVFVLHGERLRGGFALQRTAGGDRPRWLLIKRKDELARPGSDVIAEP